MTDKHFNKQIIKTATRHIKRNSARPVHTASIKKMSEIAGHPEYFNQIKNRLLTAAERSDSIGNYIYWDLKSPDDISLSHDGIEALIDILKGYFSESDLRDLCEYIKLNNSNIRDI